MRGLPLLALLALASCDSLYDLTREDFPHGYTCELPSGCPTEAEVRAVQDARAMCCSAKSSSHPNVWVRARDNDAVACQGLSGGIVVWGFTPSGRMRSHYEILACVSHESCWGGCGQPREGGCWGQCGCDTATPEPMEECA